MNKISAKLFLSLMTQKRRSRDFPQSLPPNQSSLISRLRYIKLTIPSRRNLEKWLTIRMNNQGLAHMSIIKRKIIESCPNFNSLDLLLKDSALRNSNLLVLVFMKPIVNSKNLITDKIFPSRNKDTPTFPRIILSRDLGLTRWKIILSEIHIPKGSLNYPSDPSSRASPTIINRQKRNLRLKTHLPWRASSSKSKKENNKNFEYWKK
jgi:hypothetical protein